MSSNLLADLQHKVALVTGSSSGIGEASVKLFSELGAQVVITGRNEQKVSRVAQECEQLSPFNYKPLTVVGDLRNDDHIEQLMKKTVEKYAKIDILVNSAGSDIASLENSILDEDFLEKFDKVWRLDVTAMIKVCRLAMPYLIESKGVIVNISGNKSDHPNEAHVFAHVVGKAAIDALSRNLALEFGEKGVRVNTVNPGWTKTSLTDPFFQNTQFLEFAKSQSVLNHVAEAREMATKVAFLASNASSFVTGHHLIADGGSLLKST
ncbi:3-oxoacyl-[acyl-carrier-protein] reductase FabG-like protein [Dinothrombium tinctorium]|uniref:3-oxoacyl-[acyl-carrier-protein] reductase FabG-like protein n=2 Tax=Dinothrombium tinctorium TaxID=1965070 RepID=A0A3S3NU81_9ACAR|nr:3-oxoacyl-[acyl-carrier-protein] reductase FabG-like protein [Dinothrombium tinctorium]RWS06171.1 3-oxoacyl-[acyl-carrier-protein] reductase FabG-like protein [Dinothrombium tinctorium]